MDVTWLDPANLGRRDIAATVGVLEEARELDAPHALSPTVSSHSAYLRHGWDGDAPLAALARDDKAQAVGVVEVYLPTWDNRHLAYVSVTVAPGARGRGFGRQLFECGLERVTETGRRLVMAESLENGSGPRFLQAMGLQRASRDVQRRQDLRAVQWGRLDEAHAKAHERAVGYELVRVPSPCPDDLLTDVVQITSAINDAPRDDLEYHDEVFSVERLRAFEMAQEALGRRMYRLAVRHRARGCLAGHTMVAVEADRPWYASQFDTSVVPAHRGHRLGLLLKSAMLHWLREDEPQVRTIDTWNAASNAHMIEVNELLGYRVVVEGSTWQRHL